MTTPEPRTLTVEGITGAPPSVYFTVRGVPVPQGSIRAFVRGGKPVLTSDAKGLREWRDAMAWQAHAAMNGKPMLVGALTATVNFTLTRPKSHFRASGEVKPSAPAYPTSRPDVDKLLRAALDSMSGVVYIDDASLVGVDVSKGYVEDVWDEPGVTVFVREEAI